MTLRPCEKNRCCVAAKIQPARSLASLILASSGCSCASISAHASDFATRGGAKRLPSRPRKIVFAGAKSVYALMFLVANVVNTLRLLDPWPVKARTTLPQRFLLPRIHLLCLALWHGRFVALWGKTTRRANPILPSWRMPCAL